MSLNLFLFISIAINLIIILIINKKKIKTFFYRSKLDVVDVTRLHYIFELNTISKNLKGPKQEAIIKSFAITSNNRIVGMTSDYEAWIISTLSKISKNIFEFGTCSGKTTTLMAINSPADTKIVTLTINVDQAQNLDLDVSDNKTSIRNIVNESQYQKFIFTGKKYENKIEVKFLDSRKLDTLPYRDCFVFGSI